MTHANRACTRMPDLRASCNMGFRKGGRLIYWFAYVSIAVSCMHVGATCSSNMRRQLYACMYRIHISCDAPAEHCLLQDLNEYLRPMRRRKRLRTAQPTASSHLVKELLAELRTVVAIGAQTRVQHSNVVLCGCQYAFHSPVHLHGCNSKIRIDY